MSPSLHRDYRVAMVKGNARNARNLSGSQATVTARNACLTCSRAHVARLRDKLDSEETVPGNVPPRICIILSVAVEGSLSPSVHKCPTYRVYRKTCFGSNSKRN